MATPKVEANLAKNRSKAPKPDFQVGIRELAWMAGVLDMKGRVSKIRTATRATPLYRIIVETANIDVSKRLAKYTGTRSTIAEERKMTPMARRNCSEHCPDAHNHVTTRMPTIGRWDMSGVGAIIVLANLMPYFCSDVAERQAFIDEALKSVPEPDPKRQGWAAVARTINRLYALGWRIPEELLPKSERTPATQEQDAK